MKFQKLYDTVNFERDGWVWIERVGWIIFPLCPKPLYMPLKVNAQTSYQLWAVTPCMSLSCTCFSSEVHEVLKTYSQFWAWWLSMGGKGALNLLPIVPKAFVYVPKVMRKPVMGGNTVYETFTHMFLFQSAWSFKNFTIQSILSVMAEYG